MHDFREEMNNILWETNNFKECYEQKEYTNSDLYKILKSKEFNRILDIGCARAGLLKALRIPQVCYTGFDISRAMINQNKKDYPRASWDIGDATGLPYNDNSFDVVVCSNVLIHIKNWKQALDECLRVSNKYILLVIRNKIGQTKYSMQTTNGYTVPYNIFGKDFWEYLRQTPCFDYIESKKIFMNLGKCVKYYFPIWTTTLLVKTKCELV